MGIGTFLSTTAGVVVGGGIGLLVGGALGFDVNEFVEALEPVMTDLQAEMSAAGISEATFQAAIESGIEKLDALSEADQLKYFDIDSTDELTLAENGLPVSLPDLSGKAPELLSEDEIKAYTFLQDNWGKFSVVANETIESAVNALPAAAIGGTAGAAAGGYGAYRLTRSGDKDWADKVAAQRAAQTSPQLG